MSVIGAISVAVRADSKQFESGMKRVRGSAQRTQKSMGGLSAKAGLIGVAVAVATTAIYGAVRAFKAMHAATEKLNVSMSKSLSIMGNVSDSMRSDMRALAIDLSGEVVASADQLADSYFFLASAGLNAEQSMASLPQVAMFAQAGMFDMALATDLATDAQSALGLASKDTETHLVNLTRVTDVFVKANTLANATVQQFSEAITNKAGAALRNLGKDIEEGVAVLAALADQGVKGAEAGTQFGIVLRDLQTKAIKNKKAFKEMHVEVFDAAGEMRNIADIVGDLERALSGMGDEQKKTTLLLLGFSDKSVSAIQNLLGTSEKIRDYETALRSAGGTTKEVSDKMLTPFQKMTAKLSRAFLKMSEEIMKVFSPIVMAGLNLLVGTFEGFATILNIINDALQKMYNLLGNTYKNAVLLADVLLRGESGELGPLGRALESHDFTNRSGGIGEQLTPDGLTQAQQTIFDAHVRDLETREAPQWMLDLDKFASKFLETLTPLQRLQKELAMISNAVSHGLLTVAQAEKRTAEITSQIDAMAIAENEAARKAAEDSLPEIIAKKLPEAMRFGSAAAASFLNKQGGSPEQKILDVNKQQLGEHKKANNWLKDIAEHQLDIAIAAL